MERVHFATMDTNLEGRMTLTLREPGFPDKQAARKGARDLEPGEYYTVIFDSPTPVVVAPPPTAVRNVVKFGKPFVERAKKATNTPKKQPSAKAK